MLYCNECGLPITIPIITGHSCRQINIDLFRQQKDRNKMKYETKDLIKVMQRIEKDKPLHVSVHIDDRTKKIVFEYNNLIDQTIKILIPEADGKGMWLEIETKEIMK